MLCSSVGLFKPLYRLGHPENYLFSLYKYVLIGSKYQKMSSFFSSFCCGNVKRCHLPWTTHKQNQWCSCAKPVQISIGLRLQLLSSNWSRIYSRSHYLCRYVIWLREPRPERYEASWMTWRQKSSAYSKGRLLSRSSISTKYKKIVPLWLRALKRWCQEASWSSPPCL